MQVFIIGNAASGKTTLARQFKKIGFTIVNLDCSSRFEEAEIDVSRVLDLGKISQSYKLGFNGALIKSMEILTEENFWLMNSERVVYDTPGQIEIFLYHEYGKKLCEKVKDKYGDVIVIYVVDAYDARSIESYVSVLAQAASVKLRLMLPMITVLNKIDLLTESERNKIREWCESRENIEKELLSKSDSLSRLTLALVDFLGYTNIFTRPIIISAKLGSGIDNLLDVIYEIHCVCGDLS